MTALDSITETNPDEVFALLPSIGTSAETESVIARDHAVGILVKLARNERFASVCLPDLMQQLRTFPDNQFPMYAEMTMPIISQENKQGFLKLLKSRQSRLGKDSQRGRIDRLLRKLST